MGHRFVSAVLRCPPGTTKGTRLTVKSQNRHELARSAQPNPQSSTRIKNYVAAHPTVRARFTVVGGTRRRANPGEK
jgi:hypothetical protein